MTALAARRMNVEFSFKWPSCQRSTMLDGGCFIMTWFDFTWHWVFSFAHHWPMTVMVNESYTPCAKQLTGYSIVKCAQVAQNCFKQHFGELWRKVLPTYSPYISPTEQLLVVMKIVFLHGNRYGQLLRHDKSMPIKLVYFTDLEMKARRYEETIRWLSACLFIYIYIQKLL